MNEKCEHLAVAFPYVVLIALVAGIAFIVEEVRRGRCDEDVPLHVAVWRVVWGRTEYLSIVATAASMLLALPFMVCQKASLNAIGSILALVFAGWYLVLAGLRWLTTSTGESHDRHRR
jgi:hypothetical protein